MKSFIGTAAISLMIALGACGADDAATSADRQDPRFATVTGIEGEDLKIVPPKVPPPKKAVRKRDLKTGSGPSARLGDTVVVHFLGVNYKTGAEQYDRWPPAEPLEIQLGSAGAGLAWERSLVGMKTGGVREVIVPSHLQFKEGTIDYVVKLLRLKPAPGAQQNSQK